MKLTRKLAQSQLKVNRRRTIWTVLGIILSTTMITTVYGLVASTMELIELLWSDSALQPQYETMMASLGVILSLVIIASSIVVLSNAFRVSAKERTMQFGILKSVGATKKQIRQTVVSESLLLAAIGIPIGLLAGLILHLIGVELINHFLSEIFRSARPDEIEILSVRFVLSPQALLLSIGLALATVLLSAWFPARKAAKIPAIDAIRGAGEVKVTAKGLRASWIAGKLFGVEGTLAARSLRRSRRNFRATVVALSLSVALMITLGSFVIQMNRLVELTWPDMDANVVITYRSHGQRNEETGLREYTLISRGPADAITGQFQARTNTPVFGYGRDGDTYSVTLPREMLSSQLLEYWGEMGADITVEEQWFSLLLITVDPVHYAMLAQRAGVPLGSNILVNHSRRHTPDGRRWEFEPLRFSGQTLELSYRLPDGDLAIRELPLHGVLGIGEVPNEIMRSGTQDVTVVVPELHGTRHYSWFVAAEDPFAFAAHAAQVIAETNMADAGNWHVFNAEHEQEMIRSLSLLVMTLVWGFVGLLTLIYLTNIISTISANVQSRSGEFAVLQSVGMTRAGLGRMLGLESVLSSAKALFIGFPLGILGAYLVHRAITEAAQFAFRPPWIAMALSVIAVFALTWIVMHYAARQLRKRNIVDTIHTEGGV